MAGLKLEAIKRAITDYIKSVFKLWLDLCKIMIPVIVAVKILNEFDAIRYLAIPLSPAMKLVGLPAEMGLVWATAMLNNIYGGIIVLLSLSSKVTLTGAQATVLGTMILVAHTLPVELSIAGKSGARPLFQAISRLGSALLLGMILNWTFSGLEVFQEPAAMMLPGQGEDGLQGRGFIAWMLEEAGRLLWILAVIAALVAMMRILRAAGVIRFMDIILRPILKLLGIGPKASAITVIGLTMGVAYGGGLIIQEAKSGEIGPKDVFYCLTLMGLAHSLIEDTFLIMTIGGEIAGILVGRVVYALVMVMLIVRVSRVLPLSFCERFLWKRPG
jgi:hypothetical protein